MNGIKLLDTGYVDDLLAILLRRPSWKEMEESQQRHDYPGRLPSELASTA